MRTGCNAGPRLLIIACCAALATLSCRKKGADDEEASIHYDPVAVRVCTAKRETLHPTLDLIGTLVPIPERTAVMSPQVGGIIARVAVVEGQTLSVGDEIVGLDPRLSETSVARLSAAVDEKLANLSRLKRGFLREEIDAAQQDVSKFVATLEALRTKQSGLGALRERNEISEIQFQSARQALQAAEAEVAASKAKLALLQAGTRPESIAEAVAQLAIANADLDAAKLAVEFCRITSPIGGVVTQLAARQGMNVDRGSAVATIVDESTLFLQFRIPGAYLAQVKPGTSVLARNPAIPGRTFPGSVTRLAGQADPTTGTVDAFAAVKNDDSFLRPGLSCTLSVALPDVENAVVIPSGAVADRGGASVVTIVKNLKAREIEVRLGAQTHDQVQVLEGIAVDDSVVTENGYGLPDNCPVRIVSDDGTSAGADAR